VIENGAYGYGEWICSLESRLSGVDSVEIDPKELVRALARGETFDDVEIDFPNAQVQKVGDFNRTFLFVVGAENVLGSLASEFEHVSFEDESLLASGG